MKKTYLLLVAIFIAFTTSGVSFAQTWDEPVPEGTAIADLTTCYVYNIGAKQFLDRGGEWSAQAIVASGSLITPVQNSALWILQYDASAKTLFPADVANGWTFSDGSGNNTWDIQSVDVVNNIYTIQVNSTYGGYNAAQYLGAAATAYNSNRGLVYDVRYDRAASDYTKWKFCTAAAYEKFNVQVKLDKLMNIAKLVGSSVDLTSYITTYNTGTPAEIIAATANLNTALAPTDKTMSITNANFDIDAAGWTATVAPAWGSNEIEYWQKNFDLNQTINDLPAGIYVVKVQGFERPIDASVGSKTAYQNGWDVLNTRFYATASGTKIFQPLKNYFAETTSPVGTTVDGLLFPNSMADAQTAFTAGLYDTELSYVVVDASGSLTLGVSNVYDNNKAGRWVIMDNFRLYYYGALAIPNLTVSQTSMFITNIVETTKTFDVTGANLTADITITAPAGITLSGDDLISNGNGNYTIALANANTTKAITATWDEVDNLTGTIVISSVGAATKEISISTSKDGDCFEPIGNPNLIPNPYMNSLVSFGGWGHKAVVYGAEAYCGAAAVKFNATTNTYPNGAALDVAGIAWEANSTYRVRAMVKSVDGTFAFLANGADPNVTISVPQSNDEWVLIDETFTTGANPTTSFFTFNNVDGASTGLTAYIDNYELYNITSISTGTKTINSDMSSAYVLDNKVVVKLNLELSGEVELSVYNVNGMLINFQKSVCVNGYSEKVLNTNLQNGVYFVKVTIAGKSSTLKIVK
jgi:hypothetical protein